MLNNKRRTVTITEQGFEPSGIPAAKGQSVLVEFVNRTHEPHVIEFDLPTGPVRLVEPLAPGRRTFVRFVSENSGVFKFRCPDDEKLCGALVIDQADETAGKAAA